MERLFWLKMARKTGEKQTFFKETFFFYFGLFLTTIFHRAGRITRRDCKRVYKLNG